MATPNHGAGLISHSSLAHYGVKGMRWGVRNSRYTSSARKVAIGEGSKLDTARVVRRASPHDLALARGKISGVAQRQVNRADKKIAKQDARSAKRAEAKQPKDVTTKTPLGKPGIKAAGGHNQPKAEEAVRTAVVKQKAHTSGLHSLSNKEIQDAVNRMRLEKQYKELTAKPGVIAKGQKFVKSLFGIGNTANQAVAFANSPAGKQLAEALKNDN